MTESKIAVITGANRGLGLALTNEFAGQNWQAIGTGRSEQPEDFPARALYRRFDASSAVECESFWKQLLEDYPEAEVCLVNNAGSYVSGGLTETTPEDYMQQMQSCYFSAVYITRSLAFVVPQAKIINIISSSALVAHKTNSAYGAAKAAEMHFFRSLQEEFSPRKYRITNVYPDNIATHGADPESITPEDLAGFVQELASSSKTYYLRDVTLFPVGSDSKQEV
jgi:NAD(P)-dependent dehydrogenase (short-subunit alcohol dehydrogenase family)